MRKCLLIFFDKLILKQGKIDFLITEGTMLSCLGEKARSENELKKETVELTETIQKCICHVFIYRYGTIATFYAANKEIGNRSFVCDDSQNKVLEIFSDTAEKKVLYSILERKFQIIALDAR